MMRLAKLLRLMPVCVAFENLSGFSSAIITFNRLLNEKGTPTWFIWEL